MSNPALRAARWSASVLLLSAASASAQEATTGPGHREGFWATIGGGYALQRATCTECPEDTPYRDRPGFYLQLGGVVGKHLLASGEIFTHSDDASGNSTRVTNWTGSVQWYPWSHATYIKLGLGMSRGRNSFVVNGEENNEARTGLGIMIGLGHDVRLSRTLSLSPTAHWYMSAVGDFETVAGRASSVSSNTWFLGMGLTLN